MDLGATRCLRRKPACENCPLAERGVARAQGRVADLPTPRPRRALPVRETAMLVLRRGDEVLLERRAPTGVWGGLWSLPEVQAGQPDSVDAALLSRFGVDGHSRSDLPAFEHVFTHFRLRVRPVLIEVDARSAGDPAGLVWLPLAEIDDAALPRPVKSLLQRIRDASRRSDRCSA
jgi:A/G-specific adenine glycosylase